MKLATLLPVCVLLFGGCVGPSRLATVQNGKLDCSAGLFVFEMGKDQGGIIPSVDPSVTPYTDADLTASLAGTNGSVEEINLTAARITRASLEEIARAAPGVKSLNLSGTNLTNDDLQVLRGLTSLEVLDLSGTSLSDAGCAILASLPKLKVISANMTKITEVGLEKICASGRELSIGCVGTGVTDNGVERIRKLYPKTQIEIHNRSKSGLI